MNRSDEKFMQRESLMISQKCIAEALGGGAEVARRVGRWSKDGLLKSERHPGTGNHRIYEDASIEAARVLNLLADLGVDVRGKQALTPVILANPKVRSALEFLRNRV